MATKLKAADLERAAEHGLGTDELERQLALLAAPPSSIELDRPCTVGDGVQQLDDTKESTLLAAQASAVASGRATYFVPSSGAASRMFKSLLAVRDRGPVDRATLAAKSDDEEAKAALRFFDGARRFAFAENLARVLAERGLGLDECLEQGAVSPVLDALLEANGLAYPRMPKGLLPFHSYDGNENRTAFDEHLVESFAVAADEAGATRLHFTVSPDHREAFEHRARQSGDSLGGKLGARFDIGFSTQKPSTDTVAVNPDGTPFRGEDGELLFRPGGHGSLIANLADLAEQGVDLLFVKNIDNVVHDDWRAPVVHWRRMLAGRLVVLQDRLFGALRALEEDADRAAAVEDARAVLATELGQSVPGADASDLDRAGAALHAALHRPTRVCAVLRAEGDPGGGPFWVRESDGSRSPQIVETAQIDPSAADQRAAQERATHFSPADMVLGVRDHRGRPFDLLRHVDPEAVFIAEKSSGGRPLRALEHPGLWNGGMSKWNTLFVEVPPEIFQPVKALTDLLAPAHQPSPDRR